MILETISYLDNDGNLHSKFHQDLDNETLLRAYRIMNLTRQLDSRMITLQRQGAISFAMSSRGEETLAVASCAALKPQDWMYCQYREQAAVLFRGHSLENYLHHMFGNQKDHNKGRQMPNHFGSKEHNVVTISSTLATQIPQAAGCAYGQKIANENAVTICYFGEGAASEGDFHAGINMAAVTHAPAIFFCRNNKWAISTPSKKQFRGSGIAERGLGYAIPAFRVDGNDFFAVYDVTRKARELCLKGEGPVLIEAMTYRMEAHSTADDPSCYRCKEETCEWANLCPIRRFRNYLIKHGLWDTEKEAVLKNGLVDEVEKAITLAKNTSMPPDEWFFEDIYFEKTPALIKQEMELKIFKEGNHA